MSKLPCLTQLHLAAVEHVSGAAGLGYADDLCGAQCLCVDCALLSLAALLDECLVPLGTGLVRGNYLCQSAVISNDC